MRVWWRTLWRTETEEPEGLEEQDSQEPELPRRSGRVRRKNTMYDDGTWSKGDK